MPSVTVAPRSREAFASVCTLYGSREVFGRRVSGKRNIAAPSFLIMAQRSFAIDGPKHFRPLYYTHHAHSVDQSTLDRHPGHRRFDSYSLSSLSISSIVGSVPFNFSGRAAASWYSEIPIGL